MRPDARRHAPHAVSASCPQQAAGDEPAAFLCLFRAPGEDPYVSHCDRGSLSLRFSELQLGTVMKRSVLLAVLLSSLAHAQQPAPGRQRIVTTTRLIAVFSNLEHELMTGVQQKNKAAVQKLLSDDFAVWTPQPPGDPTPQEDWLASLKQKQISLFRIRQMAVESLDHASVVSFVLTETTGTGAQARMQNYWIVDLWKGEGDTWKLLGRYQSEVRSMPGAASRPSGKR